jgi:hypothetical protein
MKYVCFIVSTWFEWFWVIVSPFYPYDDIISHWDPLCFIYINTHMQIYTYMYIYIPMYIYMYYVCIYICIYLCVYICILHINWLIYRIPRELQLHLLQKEIQGIFLNLYIVIYLYICIHKYKQIYIFMYI